MGYKKGPLGWKHCKTSALQLFAWSIKRLLIWKHCKTSALQLFAWSIKRLLISKHCKTSALQLFAWSIKRSLIWKHCKISALLLSAWDIARDHWPENINGKFLKSFLQQGHAGQRIQGFQKNLFAITRNSGYLLRILWYWKRAFVGYWNV